MSKPANAYRARFGYRKTVFPVIHARRGDEVRKNVLIAKNAGADGVFLIAHGDMYDRELLDLAEDIRVNLVVWTGVNCLSLIPFHAIRQSAGRVNGLWVDNAGVTPDEESGGQREWQALQAIPHPPIYFGGVAFKYQQPVMKRDLPALTKKARECMDVITTSGPGTGQAADIERVRIMHEAAEGHPIALASGITPENVADYLPYVSAFLVATGISRDFHNLDPEKTRRLIAVVHDHPWVEKGW